MHDHPDFPDLLDDEDFREVLAHLRCNCLDSEDEVIDRTGLDPQVVRKHYRTAQTIVAMEIDRGIEHDPEGAAIARGFMEYLRGLRF